MTRPDTLRLLLLSAFLAAANVLAAPKPGDMAPDQFGINLQGESPKLADYAGKVVVVSFWATWCGYCLKELPILEGIQLTAKGQVQVIAVNTQSREEFRGIERALRTLAFKLTYDAGDKGAQAYGVSGIPHLVIIGRDGKIVAVHRGYGESTLPKIVDAINLALATPLPVPN